MDTVQNLVIPSVTIVRTLQNLSVWHALVTQICVIKYAAGVMFRASKFRNPLVITHESSMVIINHKEIFKSFYR
jgi:hypothetical protein